MIGLQGIVQFNSESSAGDIYVGLGYVPDFCVFIADFAGTPKMYFWASNDEFSGWTDDAAVKFANHASAQLSWDSADTISEYAGGGRVGTAQQITDGVADLLAAKTRDNSGAQYSTGAVLPAGVMVASEIQTNSGKNLLVAFRRNQ